MTPSVNFLEDLTLLGRRLHLCRASLGPTIPRNLVNRTDGLEASNYEVFTNQNGETFKKITIISTALKTSNFLLVVLFTRTTY